MSFESKLDEALQPVKKLKKAGPMTPAKELETFASKPTAIMPWMAEVPHMDGTDGHVPSPGKPKWKQANIRNIV